MSSAGIDSIWAGVGQKSEGHGLGDGRCTCRTGSAQLSCTQLGSAGVILDELGKYKRRKNMKKLQIVDFELSTGDCYSCMQISEIVLPVVFLVFMR